MYRSLSLLLITCTLLGCSSADSTNVSQTESQPLGPEYLADSAPADAIPTGTARQSVKDGELVSLVGLIGGSPEPFVEGLAAFTIVDPKVPSCAAEESCPTPWDYCCKQDEVKDNIASVRIVDEQGNPVAMDARKLLGVKGLSEVIVTGTAKRDEQGNLSVAATKVYVKP